MAVYHKSAVITGLLDSFCLVCEVHLRGDDAMKSHITELAHKERLDSAHHLEKYKDDNIRKVRLGYYCEYCNQVLTALKVDMHVSGEEHQKEKRLQQLVSRGDVIVFNEIAVDDDVWHGLVNGSCVLCNTEYSDKNEHKSSPTHLLKLVQSDVELQPNGVIYRKGDDFVYCLICNEIFSPKILVGHFEHSDHMKYYNKCCELFKNHEITMNEKEVTTNIQNGSGINHNNEHDTKDAVHLLAINGENSNSQTVEENYEGKSKSQENTLAVCDSKQIKNDIDGENGVQLDGERKNIIKRNKKKVSEITDKHLLPNVSNKEINEERKKIAKENHIRYEEGADSAFCGICDVTFSSSFERITKHVAEASHKIRTEAVFRVTSKTKPMSVFVKECFCIENVVLRLFLNCITEIEVVINDEICLSFMSYSLMTQHSTHVRCQICEVNLSHSSIKDHHKSLSHFNALEKIPVFCSLKSEFVREVRPGLYHCGFCNAIEGSWTGLVNHIKSSDHTQNKAQATQKLHGNLPNIHEYKTKMFLRSLFM